MEGRFATAINCIDDRAQSPAGVIAVAGHVGISSTYTWSVG